MTDFPRSLRGYAWWIFIAAVMAAGLLALREGWPPLVPVVVFALLVIFSENRGNVYLPKGVVISPGLMVSTAAIVVFDSLGSLTGSVLIGLVLALDLSALSARRWMWVPFNAGVTGLAILSAAVSYAALPHRVVESVPLALLGVFPIAIAFSVVSWILLAFSFAIEGQEPRKIIVESGPMIVEVISLALVGLLLGHLYLDLGPAVMLLIVVPILIAREMFASYLKVKESHDETVQMLVRALETKDHYTAGHSERVARYAQYIGEELNFGPGRMERLRFAALMHDIGKLVVPNHLLNKPGKLTEDEFRRIRIHEKVSVQMLSHIDFLRPIAAASHSDHTRFDPDDPDHPIEPYIVMIADAYDAMTSTRSYRKALPQEVAFEELRDKSGKQFHPECAEALIRAIERRGERHGAGYEEHAEFENAPEAGVGSAGLGDLLSKDG